MRAQSGTARVHVIGAGLAGLAAAVRLSSAGRCVVLHEAARHAGGRCRSYFDAELGCRIDNGNHLLLTGNHAALDYLEEIGARDTLEGPRNAVFPFIDVATGQRWALRPNHGVVPWWIFAPGRRVPGTRARDYLGALALPRAGPSATIAAVLDPRQRLFRLLWEPLVVAALNTSAAQASATLFGTILSQTLGRGGAACRPLVPRIGLSETFVDPALVRLRARGAQLRFGARLRALRFDAARVSELVFDGDSIRLGSADHVVLAVPAVVAARLVPGLVVPDLYSPIVNAHFRRSLPQGTPLFVGVVGGAVEWIFRKREVLSVTVSAAERIVDRPRGELRELFWRDVATAYGVARDVVPPGQIVKERRATFLASPEQLRRRPGSVTSWGNLLLAGDYVDTGLP
ncbi:MAG: FAD-dependent oxidoreductase, partial [Alphaproteobacteria bacterium]|nr:FAD-dependent oxidoreductase [Alphaproteobacteria bacterium]